MLSLIFHALQIGVILWECTHQNVNQNPNGEILQYQRDTGDFKDALVDGSSLDSPVAPRGLIRGPGNTVYVADFNPPLEGNVDQYDAKTGKFLGKLNTTGFAGAFFPRGIVRGPDDLIYVSGTGNLSAGDVLTGYVLRFNPQNGKFVDVFTSNAASGCAASLHRPEGLVFGPDENLYVTSFRADNTDTDKVLIFNGKTGKCVDQIDLYNVQRNEPRVFAQALVFGPNKRLFVPINNTGEVRRYNVSSKNFNVFVPSTANGGHLQQPWYLSFGKTDPRTLEYDN